MADDTVPTDVTNKLALTLEPSVEDEATGALWVHKDYIKAREAWAAEQHQGLPHMDLKLGDVESWVSYVHNHGRPSQALLTWSAHGLHAILDHWQIQGAPDDGESFIPHDDYCVSHDFKLDQSFVQWSNVAGGAPVAHQTMIEFLENHFEEVLSPPATELIDLLRGLRGNYKAMGDVTLNPDGTSKVTFSKENGVQGAGGGEINLPTTFEVLLPVLQGWNEVETNVDEGKVEGALVRYKFVVRLRVNVGTDGHIQFRLQMPQRERVLAQVYGEIVGLVKGQLGPDYKLLRAAD